MNKKLDIFDEVDNSSEFNGILLINDNSERSRYIFGDWGMPILRPNSQKSLEILDKEMSDSSEQESSLDQVAGYVVNKLGELNRETFFLVVSFNPNREEKFELLFSKGAKFSLLEPIIKNFSASGQRFTFSKDHTNKLFKKIESIGKNISCFELKISDRTDSATPRDYPVERIFEETLIFSNLAITKKI